MHTITPLAASVNDLADAGRSLSSIASGLVTGLIVVLVVAVRMLARVVKSLFSAVQVVFGQMLAALAALVLLCLLVALAITTGAGGPATPQQAFTTWVVDARR